MKSRVEACFVSGLHELFLLPHNTGSFQSEAITCGSPNGGVKIENKSGSHLGFFLASFLSSFFSKNYFL